MYDILYIATVIFSIFNMNFTILNLVSLKWIITFIILAETEILGLLPFCNYASNIIAGVHHNIIAPSLILLFEIPLTCE